MWENNVEPDRPHMKICRMRTACWIPKATNAQNVQYFLPFHGNHGYPKVPQHYVIVHCPSYYRQIQDILIKRLYHSLSTSSWLLFSKGIKVKMRPNIEPGSFPA